MYKHNLEIEIDLITIITTNRKKRHATLSRHAVIDLIN